MTDQRQRFAQQLPTPRRTEVLSQQSWQPAPPPQASWQPGHAWPHQPQQPQAGWPQQAQQHWQPQHWQPQQWQPQHSAYPQLAGQPSSEEKNAAVVAYAGALIMPVVLPLLLMLTATNKQFQRAAALQALVVQLGGMALAVVLPFATVAVMLGSRGSPAILWLSYLPMLLVALYSLAFAVMGARAALGGRVYWAPLIGRSIAKAFRAEWPSG